MQIVQIIHGVHNLSAGPTHTVARLTDELCALGEEASILTLGRKPGEWQYTAPLKVYKGLLEHSMGISLSLMHEVRMLSRNPCILHDHGIWRITNLFPMLVRQSAPARIMCSPRGTLSPWSMRYKSLVKQPFWQLLQKPALHRCHCFHATARDEYEHIRQQGFRAPVAIIPNGVDVPELKPDIRRAKRVVFLGRIDPIKGLDILLPAWTGVAPDFGDWELVIAGPLLGEYAHAIQDLARKLQAPRVEFIGEVLGKSKRELLTSASLFVLPAYSENFGLVVAEALAHGVPVITTTGTPWTDLAQQNCGWRIAPNESELREALREAMSLPLPALHDMGRRGWEWMRRDYSWPSVAQKMQGAYEWLLHGGRRPDWVVV